jgi:C-terminal processing protease CtpA/Prc
LKSVFLALSFLAVQFIGPSIAAQDFSLGSRQADFKTFVQDFEDNYAYLDRADKPWLTWKTRFGPAVERAESREAFDAVLSSALGELHDFHAEVRSKVVNRWLPAPTFEDIWAEFTPNGATVKAVRRGSDAERAGVRPSDQIVKVGTQTLENALSERLGSDENTATPQARQWALLSVLTGRSDEARTLTLEKQNGTTSTITLPVERRFDRNPGAVSSNLLPGNIGLIRFNNSLGEQKTVDAFDQALSQLRSTAGLVLDLRDVPSGGDSSVALGIMGRFVTRLLAYQRHRIPNYGQSVVERNWVEFVAPRGPFTYTAPVVVLVNHWTGSMGEGMAIGFDAMHRAVVVGTPMAHLAGAVSDDKLPRTGVDVAYATEQIYHVDGTPRQNWLPPVLVDEPFADGAGDVILSRGLIALHKHTRRHVPDDLALYQRR